MLKPSTGIRTTYLPPSRLGIITLGRLHLVPDHWNCIRSMDISNAQGARNGGLKTAEWSIASRWLITASSCSKFSRWTRQIGWAREPKGSILRILFPVTLVQSNIYTEGRNCLELLFWYQKIQSSRSVDLVIIHCFSP